MGCALSSSTWHCLQSICLDQIIMRVKNRFRIKNPRLTGLDKRSAS